MTPEMRKKLEEKCREEVDRYTWETRSDVSTAEHIFMTGAQAYESLLAEMAGQDVEKAAKEYAVRTAVIVPGSFDTCEAIDAFKAGDAHGYARAKAEIEGSEKVGITPECLNCGSYEVIGYPDEIPVFPKAEVDRAVAEAVRVERERCAKVVRTCSCPDGPETFDVCCRCALKLILNPEPKEGA